MRSPLCSSATCSSSWAFVRSSVAPVSTEREMPALSLSIETCMKTMPPSRIPISQIHARRRDDPAAHDQLGLGLVAADADRQLWRADAALGAVGEEALDAPVLERVERDRREAPARRERLPRQRQRGVELCELVVDGD